MLYNFLAIDVRYPGEEISQDIISLSINISLVLWYWLRFPTPWSLGSQVIFAILNQSCTSLLNNHMSKVVAHTVHVMLQKTRVLRVLEMG